MAEGLEELCNRLDRLAGADPAIPTRRAVLIVQAAAKNNVPVNHGELRGSIYTDVQPTEEGVEGIIYTNKKYAPYVEFGTGPRGAADHKGISPRATVAYRTTGWMIPANRISSDDADRYRFGVARKNGEVIGYYTRGQPAQPYMYPAIANNKEAIIGTYREYIQNIQEMLKQ